MSQHTPPARHRPGTERTPYDPSRHPGDDAPAPVVGETWDRVGPKRLGWHAHRRGQLIYAERGAVRVEAADELFVVPPERAVWVPPGMPHAVAYPGPVAFRGVLIDARLCTALPPRPAVVAVDPLARELVRAVCMLPWDHAPGGPEERLVRVLLDRVAALRTAPLRLPVCRDERLRPIVAAFEADPADPRSVEAWAALVNLTPRTLARRFRAATGMPLTRWREQLRLVRAIERLAAGASVTAVALELGYRSPGSFSTMFRRAFGVPPGRYFATPVEEHAAARE